MISRLIMVMLWAYVVGSVVQSIGQPIPATITTGWDALNIISTITAILAVGYFAGSESEKQ